MTPTARAARSTRQSWRAGPLEAVLSWWRIVFADSMDILKDRDHHMPKAPRALFVGALLQTVVRTGVSRKRNPYGNSLPKRGVPCIEVVHGVSYTATRALRRGAKHE